MKRSKFNLTHLNSTTLDAGYLVPFLLQPTLPNDKFRIGLSTFIRAQPMLAPLMHEVEFFTQYWFVPNRLVWDNWESFITGGDDLNSTPSFPYVVSRESDIKVGSLWDYFGFPLQTGIEVSALPFRALSLIWNTRYRDEDLQQEVPISFADGLDNTTSRKLFSPCIRKDYFSVSRPYTQRGADIFVPVTQGESSVQVIHKHTIKCSLIVGFSARGNLEKELEPMLYSDATLVLKAGATPIAYKTNRDAFMASLSDDMDNYPAATINIQLPDIDINNYLDKVVPGKVNYFPIKLSTPVTYAAVGDSPVVTNQNIVLRMEISSDETVPAMGVNPAYSFSTPATGTVYNRTTAFLTPYIGWTIPIKEVPAARVQLLTRYVALSSTGAISVRDLREASALQRYAENSLKYGNRYEEFIQREFGISPRDSRIQRPEYLGGGRGLLNISEVLQTAESTDSGVGTMRGHGVGSISQRSIRFTSPEHGLIIGLLSIRPKLVYTSGVDREFLKRSRLDFFTPELSNIGMQEVLTQELYAISTNKGSVFGYSDRYQEYRYHKPLVTGEFRGNLNFWNMAVEFSTQPELNAEYVDMATYAENWKRPFQVQDDSAHAFIVMLKNHIRAYRPIPKRAKDILK